MEIIMGNSLTRKQIEEIYNAAPAPGQTNNNSTPSFNLSRDEITNIYNSYTPEIPKLEQNTTPTPTTDYRAEIERMNKLKADTTAPRTEGENQAIDTYLNSLTDAQRYLDSQKSVSTTTKSGTKVKKQPIGTVEIKADGSKKFTKAMSANEKKNFENQIRRQNQLEQAKVIGKQAKENAQPKERALSANEQRDLERAQSAIEQAKRNDNPYKKLTNTAKKFTELPKKDKPRYDDRGFEINPSITENQSTVDEYLDPNKKLSQADEEKAKQLIREYEESDLGQKNENATTLVFDNAHPDGMAVPSYAVDENGVYQPSKELTPEERQYQQSIGALKTKVKDSESFLVGAMQTVPFVDALQRAGDENGEYARMVANSQKQNPLSYWGGLLGTGVAMNTAGQFALNGTKYGDLINRIAGVDKAGISNRSKAIRRTLAEAAMDVPVDLATDIIPTLSSDLAQDKSAGEVIGNTAFNIGLNGLLNLAPAAISNWSDIRPNGIPEVWTPNKQATQSAVDNVIPVVDDVVPQEAKVVEEVKKAIDDIPEVVENPVVENVPENGIQVYRGYNRSDNPLEKNLAREQSIYDVLGKENPNNPDMLPLEFYTDSIDDATNYANHDKAFYESLRDGVVSDMNRQIIEGKTISDKEAYIKDAMDKAYRTLTGREPIFENGRVDTHTINPKNVLDLSELGEMTDANSVYKRLSEITGIPVSEIDNALVLSDIPNAEDGFYTYHLLKNMAGTNGDIGTRFTNFMRNQGYDAVKYGEDGANHYALLNNLAPEAAQNEKQIVSLNPDLNRAEDAALFKTLENNSNIDVKSVKAADKALDDNINSLANMFGKQKNNEGVVALKEALNEYAETGNEEALTRARTIASNMDDYYSGATYKSRKGNITEFGNGTKGTFTSQVDDYADKLKAGATLKSEPLHVTDLDKRINDLFSKYDLSAEDAESVRAWKQAINDYMAEPTEESWNNLLSATNDVSKRSSNLSEYVSSYKGKTKTNPFDNSELISIMDEIDTRRPLSSGVPDIVPAQVSGNNVPPTPPTSPITPPEGTGDLVERGASRHIRAVNDVTEYTPMKYDVPDEVSNEFIDNPDMYRQLKNVDTQARADAIYERGGDVENIFRRMLGQKDPASLALGHRIAKDYSANGQFEKAAQIYRDMGKELTQAGQFSQASVLAMMKNDPLTALYYAQKEIDKLNVDGAKRFGKKWKDFGLTPEEVKAFGKIEPGDEKAIAQLYDQVGARLGKEYPTTVMDKLLEARRVSMLFNLRTNIRNFGANVPTLGMRWVSDRVDSLGQHFVHLLDPDFEVTNSIKGAGFRGRKLANEVYNSDTVQAMLKNTNGKYSPDITNSLMQNKQVFKGTPVSRWINRVTNGGIEKVNKKLFGKEGVESGLETVRNATYKALELGDTPFVRENFVERLGSYINARGIKNINDIPDDAIQVAWEEAMKATYKDNSWAVQMLRGIKNGMESIPGVGKPISQAVIPFLQAPGNIAARMVDYSPIKATKGIVDMISGANSGNLNAVRKGIEEFSKGATGTGMIVLGMKLKESGLITGDYSEDKDQRNFEKQSGFKPYALHIGDKYFTYDWAQPFAEPMIIGTLLQEAIDNSDQYDSEILKYFGHEGTTAGKIIGGLKEGASASVNSWFNASPLQGLADLMKSDYSGDKNIAENIYDKTVVDFASSFIPSLVNSAAKTADPIMRNTYDPSNAFGTFLNEQAAKLPGASDNLPAKFDTWGNEMKYADSKGESFARKFVIPGDYGKMSDDPVDQEINSLFDATSDNRVFPLTAPNSVDGVKLNNREVSEYQEDMGTRSREIVESFMDSDYYNDLADNEKAETLNTIYSVSKAITERDLFDKPVADNSTYKKAIEAYDEDGAEGLLNYLEGKAVAKEAGVSATSKAGAAIQDLFNSGDKEGAQRLSEEVNRLSDEGLNTEQQGVYASRGSIHYAADEYAALYDEINTDDKPTITQKEALAYINDNFNGTPEDQREALQVYESMVTKYTPGESKFAKYDPAQKKYVAVDSKDAKNQFKTTLIPKVEPIEEPARKNQDAEWDNATLSSDPYTAISQSGVGHGNAYMNKAWDKAVLANSSLTPQEFIDTWAAIDSSGNGKHTKDEFKAYLNDNSIDQEEGNMILDMYYPSNWNRPTYKKGKWS